MTKQETIQVLQSIEDRAIDFPNMTECDWVAIAAAKRHLMEKSVSDNFEEVKNLICNNICDGCKCKGINRLNNCKTLEKYMNCYRIGYENASNNK